MSIIIGLLVLNGIVFIHELGHAIAMWHRGVVLKTFAIGFKIKGIPNISFKLKRFNNVSVEINPLLLGGYVEPSEEGQARLEELSCSETVVIFGAGIVTNLISGFLCMAIAVIANADNLYKGIFGFAVLSSPAVILFLARRFFCRYLIVPLGLLTAALVIYSCQQLGIAESMGGPVAVVELFSEQRHDLTVIRVLDLSFAISLGVALVNSMPLPVLDGGHIFDSFMQRFKFWKKAGEWHRMAGTIVLITIVWLTVVTDIARLIYVRF